jgi:hypothetical protein
MIRRCAARIANRTADLCFRLGDWLVRLAYRLDPGNALMSELADEAPGPWDQGPAQAAPRSCMPNAPYGSAPQWALDVVKHRGGTIVGATTDPIWQHATCDKAKHTVT